MNWFKRKKNSQKSDSNLDEISGAAFDQFVFWRMLPYLRIHQKLFLFCLVLVLVSTGVALFSPRLLGILVDKALIPHNRKLLFQLTGLYFFLDAIRITGNFIQNFLLQKIGQRVMQSIRMDLYSRLIRMPIPFFDKNPAGRLVTRVTNDTANLSEIFSSGFVVLLSDVLIIIGVLAAIISMHWKLGLLSVAVFPIMLFLMTNFAHLLRAAFRRSRRTLSKLNGFFAEQMSGMPIVQLMGREDFERANFEKISEEYRNHQFRGVHLYSLFHPAITFLSAISMSLAIFYGAKFLELGEIPMGTYVAILAYIQVLYQPVRNITDRYNVFLAAMSSADRIFSLLDMPEEEDLRAASTNAHAQSRNISGELIFENVSFSYDETSSPTKEPIWSLKDINFKISAGENIAIVGHTGAGKTTLLSLLFRFYDLKHGSILLDGKNLQEYSKNELRERIGFVQQDVFLFAGTIRENLTLLRQGISDDEILEASTATGFHRILEKLPQALDTVLDERGANLSLGERQILSFTRVYLQKPDILVLDEATSSVDHESELQMQKATEKLVEGRTSIIIAHRLSTIKDADRIFVFEKGRLAECGTHAELVIAGGIYHHLVSLQDSSTGAHNTSSM